MLSIGCAVTDNEIQTALEKSRNTAAKKRGDTELHIAAARGDSAVVSDLINRGVDLNEVNDNDQTALMMSIRQEQPATARLLIEQRAKVDVADERGDTALHLAIRTGQRDIVQALLAQGADPNRPNKAKEIPLLLATKADYPEIAWQLLEKNVRIDVVDGYKLTPLHYATNWHQTGVAQKLIQRGLNPDVRAPNGQTPLMVAAYFGDLPTADLLLEKGAKVDLRDEEGRTSLHLAARNGSKIVISALLNHGADINSQTKSGHTPVLLAAQNDHPESASYLISRGASFIPIDVNPRTTFSSALIAQAMAEEARTRQDISKAREYHKLASDWFEKAATAYQDASDTADNKILAKKIFKAVGIVALTAGLVIASQQYASVQHAQALTQAAAQDVALEAILRNAGIVALGAQAAMAVLRGDTGQQGYFSEVVKYENVFQLASDSSMQAPSLFQSDAMLGHLRGLYRELAQQARDHAQRNATRSTSP